MIFADRIVLFANNCELTRGECDLLSIMMNRNNETVPTHNSTIINGELRKLSVCEYESTNRNEETVTARVIVPFISKVYYYLSLTYCQDNWRQPLLLWQHYR
jgi:hypothetical protein